VLYIEFMEHNAAPTVQTSGRHDDLTRRLITAREEVTQAQRAADEAIQPLRAACLALIAEARTEGLSHAQIAAILGVTRARAQQLANKAQAAGHGE
jgi:DNA-directed RNA polymerase specialized sigma24 family protein